MDGSLFLSDLFVHLERVASEVPHASWAEHFFGCPLKSSGVCVCVCVCVCKTVTLVRIWFSCGPNFSDQNVQTLLMGGVCIKC